MMDVRYKRDLNSNYMIMTDAEGREETYEDRMITENRIYGFLPCVEQKKEKQTEYFGYVTENGVNSNVHSAPGDSERFPMNSLWNS